MIRDMVEVLLKLFIIFIDDVVDMMKQKSLEQLARFLLEKKNLKKYWKRRNLAVGAAITH